MEKTQLMKKQRKEETIPEGLLTKDFLKTLHGQEDVDRFLNDLHSRLYEYCFKQRWMSILVMRSIA
ncbi:MAG TPA: hypothetical protein PK500_07295 [Candidatus Egerieousia sp.]|jgi:hypothetical protein|nr:hypothetical protein [Candidatus Egerieousia sp.]HPT06437.1 hypothetical protein [Candidatus Egerieousia sp.]